MPRQLYDNLGDDKKAVVGQLLRYAVAGAAITIAMSLAYWLVADWGGVDPNLSLLIVFIIFNFISYAVHGRFSFRGHGGRDRPHIRNVRFLTANIAGFVLNQFWVWLLVKHLGGETWWPTIPFILVTPWLTFVLHRKWVYA